MPKDKHRTKAQLIRELEELHRQNAEFEVVRETLRRSQEELKVRNRIAEVFLTVPDDGLYPEVLKVLLEATNSRHGVFGYLDENRALVVPSITVDAENKCQTLLKVNVFAEDTWGDSAGARAIREMRSVCSNEPSVDVPEPYIPVRRHISLPILQEGEVLGLIQVANRDTNYDESDIRFLETIAEAMASALSVRLRRQRQENTRHQAEEVLRKAYQELERRFQEQTEELARVTRNLQDEIAQRASMEDRSRRQQSVLAAVGKILQDVSTCIDERAVARTCLGVARQLTGSTFGYFAQANPAGRFDVIAWVNPDHDPSPAPESDAALQVGNMAIRGIWGRVLKDGRSHIINEPGPDPDAPAVPEGYPPLTCFLGVPLRYAGKILGTIALVNKPSGYDDIDQEAMEALSPVIVAALIHKRAELSLREAQQQRIRHEQLAVLRQLAGGRDREMPAWIRRVHEALLSCLGRGRTRASSVPGRLRRSLTYASNAHDSPRKVLIASPRPALQEAVKSALRSEDQATVVETVNVGEEGLRIARDTRPDVIVVDLGSAGMGGFRTISLLRDQLSDARIIAVGPCDTKSAKITARECGADRLVLGSLQGRDLVQAIRRAILPR